jgi:hypothetical protein
VVEDHEIQVSRERDDPARIVANGLETHNNRTVLNVQGKTTKPGFIKLDNPVESST